jgi:hypothetical protein
VAERATSLRREDVLQNRSLQSGANSLSNSALTRPPSSEALSRPGSRGQAGAAVRGPSGGPGPSGLSRAGSQMLDTSQAFGAASVGGGSNSNVKSMMRASQAKSPSRG